MQAKEKFSVLLVDDDPTVIRILSRILSEYAPLRFATSGHAALKLARESLPDLVILDVEMPEFSGFEVCKAFKSDPALAAVPIIFITSHDSVQLETAGLKLGAADFIGKPPSASLVLARVRTYQQLKTLSDTVRSAVTMDFLTGTATRRHLEKSLAQECLQAQRCASPLSLLIFDILGFTALNARLGDERGDACLRAVADALRSIVHRPSDLLARHAGGRFALLLPDTDCRGAEAIARRALRAAARSAESSRIALAVGGVSQSAAAGIAVPAQFIATAEAAARDARQAGDPSTSRLKVLCIEPPLAGCAIPTRH